MTRISDVFQFEQTGATSVIRVNPEGIADYARVEQCRDELLKTLAKAECSKAAFDLDGVPFLASGVLGLLISLRKANIEVEFRNTSAHVREVMHATKLDELVRVYPATS